MYGCESCTIPKAECRRIGAFELWCWRRLLRVPWTARRSNQAILKEISPEYSVEGLMWKLKLQYFGHLMRRADSLEKTLMLGKIEGRRKRGQQRMRWFHGIADSVTWVWASSRSWLRTRKPGVLQSMGSQRVAHEWATEQQQWEDAHFPLGLLREKNVGWGLDSLSHRKERSCLWMELTDRRAKPSDLEGLKPTGSQLCPLILQLLKPL